MWGIIVFLTIGLYNMFKNPQTNVRGGNKVIFSEFLTQVDNGEDLKVEIKGNNIKDVDDIVTTFSPGVGLQYGQNLLDSNYIGIDYSPSFLWYADNNELNTDNHLLTFGINYQKEGKFTFSGADKIGLSNTLLRGRERAFFSNMLWKTTHGLRILCIVEAYACTKKKKYGP